MRIPSALLFLLGLAACGLTPSCTPPQSVTPVIQTAPWAKSWWMPRHKEKTALAARGGVDLLFVGDSITHSWEKTGRKVFQRFYGKRRALNLGFSGDRTEHVLWRLRHGGVAGIDPKVAVVMIGTNNAGHRKEDPAQTARGVEAVVLELRRRLPRTKILLLAIFPRGRDDGDELRKLNRATNKRIAGLADGKRVVFLDINDRFLGPDRVLSKSIMPDLLHPNERGYRIWAEAMEPTLKRLLGS